MSFRLRLILAFAGLALVQALLFAALSDQLIRDGLEGEANARLGLIASLLPLKAPAHDWPLLAPPAAETAVWREALQSYAKRYDLSRATLLLKGEALDSKALLVPEAAAWWQADGLAPPLARGMLKVSGPLYRAEDGWRKVLYAKLDANSDAWLRVEAGTPFLGQVAALQKRLWRLSAVLVLPSLLAGLALGWALSRRARALALRLQAPAQGVRLGGRDEFAAISAQAQELLDSLAAERAQSERLSDAKLRQARDLALGVAHELRNPLAGLSLMSELFERRRKEGAGGQELAELAARLQVELSRIERTVARFLDFSRAPQLAAEDLELGACLAKAMQGVQPVPRALGATRVLADKQALLSILGALLGNAAEAAGPTGRIHIELAPQGAEARLRIWDSGAPVPEQDRGRLFTPFFTTKAKGLGLGLATAASLADHLGGRLSLHEDGKTFELSLPLPPPAKKT